MYRYADIRTVHLELTTRCNARCPQCPRNLWGGPVNPSLPQAELSAGDCERLFPVDLLLQLQNFYACGNYGDPVAARDTLPVFARARACNPDLSLTLYTNGSAREPAWWAALARLGCTVRFAIDGLRDTNHLYRRGTNWDTIMRSVQAFIEGGGRAEWAFIVFRHNEHQVEAASKLAAEMGFRRFLVRHNDRFEEPDGIGASAVRASVYDVDGVLEYHLEPPSHEAQFVTLGGRVPGRLGGSGSSRLPDESASLMTVPISCRAVSERMVYVSAEGLVLPCCWLGGLYPRHVAQHRPQVWRLIDELPEGKESLSGLRHGICAVVESPFFQREVPDRWAPAGAGAGARLLVCARICGVRAPRARAAVAAVPARGNDHTARGTSYG